MLANFAVRGTRDGSSGCPALISHTDGDSFQTQKPIHRTICQWQFPLGDKVATLSIAGSTNLVIEDMDALLEIAGLFRLAIERGNRLTDPDHDFSI